MFVLFRLDVATIRPSIAALPMLSEMYPNFWAQIRNSNVSLFDFALLKISEFC